MPEIRDISAHQRLGLLNLSTFQAPDSFAAKRDVERAGTRYLLDRMFGKGAWELSYTRHNKPFLAGRRERISISHSHDMLAIMSDSRAETGVDIELLRDKVRRIKHKFLNETEMGFAGDDIVKLITIWAGKESMYKAYGRKQLDFRTQLEVVPYTGTEIRGRLSANGEHKSFLMKAEQIGEYMLVYILHEIQRAYQET